MLSAQAICNISKAMMIFYFIKYLQQFVEMFAIDG